MIEVKNLKKSFSVGGFFESKSVEVLNEVSFKIETNKTLGLVGESGCGKSTIAKILCGLEKPSSGEIFFDGQDLFKASAQDRRRWIQMVFQDPFNSLNPRKKAWQIISDPLVVNENVSAKAAKSTAIELMKKVGLREELAENFPHQFSGGQRQRLGIARALTLRPKLLILDEPVSALDVSIQSQVLNLLMDLQDEFGLSYLLISHDLEVVQHLSDDIMVMYLGQVVEKGPAKQVVKNSIHPYTKLLIESSPEINLQGKQISKGLPSPNEIPSVFNLPSGCRFNSRCAFAVDKCKTNVPELKSENGVQFKCFRPFASA